jgi:hypothetical protein
MARPKNSVGPKNTTLKDFPLSENQTLWLKYAYDHGGPINEQEVVRGLAGKLPTDFNVYDELRYFWSNDRLTIFGLYKMNPQDKNLVALDLMLKALKNTFHLQKNREVVTETEFAEECKVPVETIRYIFYSGYFYQFWIEQNSNSNERTGSKDGQSTFEFGGYKGVLHIQDYENLEAQIEKKWQKEIRLFLQPQPVSLPLSLMETGIVSTPAFSVEQESPQGAKATKKKVEVISVDDEGLLATWKGKTYALNSTQAEILRTCILFWIEADRVPVTLRIEQLRRRSGNEDLLTVGRAFNKNPLGRVFKVAREKGVFQFKP